MMLQVLQTAGLAGAGASATTGAAAAVGRCSGGCGSCGAFGCGLGLLLELRLVEYFALEDPDLDADDAVGRFRLGQAVIDVGAEGVQRHATLAHHSVRAISEPFRRPDMRTLMPSAPLRMVLITARFIARRNITRFSICCAMLSATSCASSSGLRISAMFRRTSSTGDAEELRRLGAQLLDVLALLADHDAGTRGLDRDVDLLGGALDQYAADRSVGQLLLQKLAHAEIGVDQQRKLLLAGVPLRGPVAGDAQTNAQRVDFLTHRLVLLAVADVNRDVAVALDDAVAATLGARMRSA
jgi:hypothetical protein